MYLIAVGDSQNGSILLLANHLLFPVLMQSLATNRSFSRLMEKLVKCMNSLSWKRLIKKLCITLETFKDRTVSVLN